MICILKYFQAYTGTVNISRHYAAELHLRIVQISFNLYPVMSFSPPLHVGKHNCAMFRLESPNIVQSLYVKTVHNTWICFFFPNPPSKAHGQK